MYDWHMAYTWKTSSILMTHIEGGMAHVPHFDWLIVLQSWLHGLIESATWHPLIGQVGQRCKSRWIFARFKTKTFGYQTNDQTIAPMVTIDYSNGSGSI